MGIVAQRPIEPEEIPFEEKDAERLLFDAAINYIQRWNQAEDELSSLLRLSLSRPLPTLVTLGGVIDVTYLLDIPHGFDWKGVYVDADLRVIECGYGESITPDVIAQNKKDAQKRTFMQLSALQGSVLEAAILEEDFQVESISTARLLGIASQGYNGQPPVPILTINNTNLPELLPSLPFPQNLKDDIAGAVSQGLIVRIPETEITYEDWTGIGYLKEDPETGEAGYMLSGMIAGAMTAWQRQRWPVYLGNKLEAPFSEPPTYDPKSALYIQKITATDLQKGIVGMECAEHLQVIVRDKDKQPVSGAEVIFSVLAGGGRLKRLDDHVSGGALQISTETDDRGIAQARLILGEQTSANPTMWWQEGYTFAQQVGENIVDATLETGASITTPFTAFGHPRAPHHLVKTHGDQQWRDILRFAGFLAVMAEDEFGNPLSNLPIDFETTPAVPIEFSECGSPFAEPRPALLINPNDPCLAGIPLYGECESGSSTQQVITDSEGASVHLIMGDVPYADYFVHASLADQNVSLQESFHLRTAIFGNCDGESPPSVRLMLTAVFPTDQYGNNINAGKIGGFLPLRAKIYLLYEGKIEQNGDILGSREYFIKTNLEDEQVMFGDIPGIFEENGLYTVSYPLPDEAGVHAVPMSGFATVGGETIAAQGFELEVFSVGILTEPEVTVSVNEQGIVTCDCPVRYTIEPPEYTASTAYVVVYKDGVALVYLPTETQGEGVGTMSRGFLIDPEGAYEAQVVLNAGTGVEMKSEPIILDPKAIRITSLYLEDAHENYPVLPGDQATMKAKTEPEGRPLIWSIEAKDEGVEAEIDPASGIIRADEKTESGFITVRATDEEVPCVYKEAKVFIGCPVCASIQPGGGVIELSSIDVFISMGKAKGGYSAGDLFLRADRPSRLLATPLGLSFSSIAKDGVEVLYDEAGALCQVLAPEALADIRVANEYSYDIRFFKPEEVTEKTDGLYGIAPSAEPFTLWRIENPDASPYTYNRLKISEVRNGTTIAHEYAWDESLQAWSLSRGNGLVEETRRQVHDPETNDRIICHSIVDAEGIPASIVRTIYHEFPWGEEIIARVEDPNGAAHTTTMTYYEDPNIEGSYGRLCSQVYPDGSWVRYDYDEQGRTILEESPWLDSPVDAPADLARATYYEYAPVDPADSQAPEYRDSPRTVTETIQGIVVSRTYYAYLTTASGDRVEIVERCAHQGAAYGDPENQRTVTTYNPSGTGDAGSGSVKSILYSDGRLDTYTYEYGTFILNEDPALSSFSPGAGTDIRETVVHGTQDHPAGIAFKTTRETSIRDALGNERMRETAVYTVEGYIRIQWTVQYFDAFGHMTRAVHSNGTQSESTWGCCGKESDTDIQGIRRNYIYDDLQRAVTEIKEGVSSGPWPSQSDIYTTYTYDAMGRRLTETTSAGDLSLTIINVYDISGRLLTSIDQAGLITFYSYDPNGLVTTVTRPGGATEITTRYLDSRTKSITGTGVIAQYYEYGVNTDGTQWTKVYTDRENSPRWEKITQDILGSIIKTERPSFEGIESEEFHYNNKGQLIRSSLPGVADSLYAYDEPGNQIRTGLDMNANGALDLDANDRINESETYYALIGGDWWEETVQRVYAKEFDANAAITGIRRTRLTSLGTDGNIAENVSIDIHGNQTITRVFIDPVNKTETRITDYPDSVINEVTVGVNGLLVSSQSKTGADTTYSYDALGRRTGITDPRTGTTVTHYNNKGQVDYVEDPAGNRTRYEYDPETGEKTVEIDALNKATRYAYNKRGQVTYTWGDVPYPVHYVYDSYGQMSEMYTYRQGTKWGSASWPADIAGADDVTRWHYDEATGLLAAKEDAAGKSVTYTYTFGGRLATRTWARMDANNPLVTAYSYSPSAGELLSIDYSDSTPDIAFTYDRLGRQKTITDAVGTRTFAYNNTLQLESETITGLYDRVITRTYETNAMPGRNSGFTLGLDGSTDYRVTYGYDDVGHHSQVGWDVGDNSGASTYSYLPGSDLIHQLTTGSGQKTTYSYEPHRDLRTQVKNEFNNQLISQYDYEYDPVGRRISVANSGQAFSSVSNAFNLYEYNNRSELTESSRYLGADLSDTNNPVQSEYRAYTYDPIGNHTQITEAAETTSYTTNALNQYTQHMIPGNDINSFDYDDDGNLTKVTNDLKDIQYIYNAENRLIAVEPQNPKNGDKKVECIYDYMGRRVSKKTYSWDLNAWTVDSEILFIYDGWNMISEIKGGELTTTKFYVWSLDLSESLQGAGGIGGLMASVDSSVGNTYYYYYDVNGNVGQLVNATHGNINAHYEHDPFGKQIVASGSMAMENPFRFSTKYYDRESRLYYYGFRYYYSLIGRWISRDPLEERGGINLYSFVKNRPINLYDIIGMSGLMGAALAEFGEAIEGVEAAFLYVDAPCWLVMWLTPKFLPEGLPVQLWNRSATGGDKLDLDIDASSQAKWDNVIDRIENSPSYQKAVKKIKTMICDERIYFKEPVIMINFKQENDNSLAYSLGKVDSNYEYNKDKQGLRIWITDTYNFDIHHCWRKCQDEGYLTPFKIKINIPEKSFNCCEEDK